MADFELMNNYLNATTIFPTSLFFKAQGPLDVRTVVSDEKFLAVENLDTYFNDETGQNPYWYVGMLVSCQATGKLYILKSKTEGFVEVGKETVVSLTAANYTAAKALATTGNIGKVIIVANNQTVTEGGKEITYVAGAYIVTAANTIMYLATSSGTGDDITIINNAIDNINKQLAHLDSYSIVEAQTPTEGAARTYNLVKSGYTLSDDGEYTETSDNVGTIDIPEAGVQSAVESISIGEEENTGVKYLDIVYSTGAIDNIKLEDIATGDEIITVNGSTISLQLPVLAEALANNGFVTDDDVATLVSELTSVEGDEVKIVNNVVYDAETGTIKCTKYAKYQVFDTFVPSNDGPVPSIENPSYITSYICARTHPVTTGEGEQVVTETVVYGYEEWIYTTDGWKMLSRPINPYEVVYHSDLVPISEEDISNLN